MPASPQARILPMGEIGYDITSHMLAITVITFSSIPLSRAAIVFFDLYKAIFHFQLKNSSYVTRSIDYCHNHRLIKWSVVVGVGVSG